MEIYWSYSFLSVSFIKGMTETCSSLTFLTLYEPMHETTSQSLQAFGVAGSKLIHQQQGVCIGKAAPHIELKISADASGHTGRILTRGPHIMLRYWDQTLTNPLNPNNEAWLDTGDIGSIDHYGNLWLLGRTNGRIKSGGENIYPEEVIEVSLHVGLIIKNKFKPKEHAALLQFLSLKRDTFFRTL